MNRGLFRFHLIIIVINISAVKLITIFNNFPFPIYSPLLLFVDERVKCIHVLVWLSCVTDYVIDTHAIFTFTKTRVKNGWILIEYSSDVIPFLFRTCVLCAKQESSKCTAMPTLEKHLKRSDFNSVFLFTISTSCWQYVDGKLK